MVSLGVLVVNHYSSIDQCLGGIVSLELRIIPKWIIPKWIISNWIIPNRAYFSRRYMIKIIARPVLVGATLFRAMVYN